MHTILNDNLEKYLEGRLSAQLQDSLDKHLTECSSCQEVVNDAMESSRLLRVLAVTEADPAPEPVPGFALKVIEGLPAGQPALAAAGAPASFWSSLGFLGLTSSYQTAIRQVAVAAVMLAVLAGGYAFSLQSSEASATAGLLFDMPVEHDAPALITGSEATGLFGHSCLRCWQNSETPAPASESATDHANREQTMAALLGD